MNPQVVQGSGNSYTARAAEMAAAQQFAPGQNQITALSAHEYDLREVSSAESGRSSKAQDGFIQGIVSLGTSNIVEASIEDVLRGMKRSLEGAAIAA